MKRKLNSLLTLQKWTSCRSQAIKLGAILLLAGLVKRLTGKRIGLSCDFKWFELHWLAGSGHLTPMAEIAEAFLEGALKGVHGKGWTVIDCGANIGIFALFLRECDWLLAVEPNPVCFRLLEKNLAVNHVQSKALNVAVSSEEGTLRMDFCPDASVLGRVDQAGQDEVVATTLDRIVDEFQLRRVDLLKLDLEGHESAALRGAQRALKSRVFCQIYAEYNSDRALKELELLLEPHGYKLRVAAGYNVLFGLDAT